MSSDLCAIILAAGEGTRLRPITSSLPKALCPVGNVASLDRALARLGCHGLSGPELVAVNACYLGDQVVAHVGDRAHLSLEPGPAPLGTAGAVANLRGWIAGRGVLVGNADAYLAPRIPATPDLQSLIDDWNGETVRVLCVPAGDGRAAEFGSLRFAGFSLLPAADVAALSPQRSELVKTTWRPAELASRLELVTYDGRYIDIGTPADYLAANLHAAGPGSLIAADASVTGEVTHSVVGGGAKVLGSLTRTVVLPGGYVGLDEHLVDTIRIGRTRTVQTGVDRTPG